MPFSAAFRKDCERLQRQDPSLSVLNCGRREILRNGDLFSNEDITFLDETLEQAIYLEHLKINLTAIDSDIDFCLRKFLQTSVSLKRLDVVGFDVYYPVPTFFGDSLLLAASHSRSLEILRLERFMCFRGETLERCLTSIPSLRSFNCRLWGPSWTGRTLQSIASGLGRNQTLEEVYLHNFTVGDENFGGTVFPMLQNHSTLKKLTIADFDVPSMPALRAFLETNQGLEDLEVMNFRSGTEARRIPGATDITPILHGLKENKSLKKITLEGEISAEANMWVAMLLCNETLEELDFDGATLEITDTAAIASGICGNKCLKMIYCGHIHKGHDSLGDGAIEWSRALVHNSVVDRLFLSDHAISDINVRILAAGLRTLRMLDLSFNRITGIGVGALATAVQTKISLQTLDLSHNTIDGTEVSANALTNLLVHGASLKRLDLCCNYELGNGGAIAIAEGLPRNNSLEEIDLSECGIKSEGARHIFRALCKNNSLLKLNLDDNEFEMDECAEAAKAMFEENTCLQLDGEMSYGHPLLFAGLRRNKTLKFLSVSIRNDEQLSSVIDMHTQNSTLECLNFLDTNLAKNGVRTFFRHLPDMHGLKKLQRSYFPPFKVDDATATVLLESLKKNTVFHTVDLDLTDVSTDTCVMINFYLRLNRCGRHLLKNREAPIGIWAPILAKTTAPRDSSALFYFLRHKPDLVNSRKGQKRKLSDL